MLDARPEAGGRNAKVAGQRAGRHRGVEGKMRQDRGVCRRQLRRARASAYVVDVAGKIDLRVCALNGSDERQQFSRGPVSVTSHGDCFARLRQPTAPPDIAS